MWRYWSKITILSNPPAFGATKRAIPLKRHEDLWREKNIFLKFKHNLIPYATIQRRLLYDRFCHISTIPAHVTDGQTNRQTNIHRWMDGELL